MNLPSPRAHRVDAMRLAIAIVVTAACPLAAQAATITDTGLSGDFFIQTVDNMAIYEASPGNGLFEVPFSGYDGDGGTPEDEKSRGSVTYAVNDPNLGIPPGESFTDVEIDVKTWNGRDEFDSQGLADIYTISVSSDGANFTPVAVAYSGVFPDPASTDGFVNNTGVATGLNAEFVRIGIQARVEAAGSGFNDPWSSQMLEVRLTSGVVIPEPASAMLALLGVVAGVGARRP